MFASNDFPQLYEFNEGCHTNVATQRELERLKYIK